jgi:hypothetical protein
MKIRVLIAAAVLITATAFAGEKPSENIVIRDAKDYVDAIEKVGKLKIDDQIDVWQTFLSDHPKTTFRKEIEKNIDLLQSLSQKKQGPKNADEREAQLYLKALEYSKKLSPADQILMWQQFIAENPNNMYKNEATIRLNKLKRTTKLPPTSRAPTTKAVEPVAVAPITEAAPKTSNPSTSVTGKRPPKDSDKALLLASVPGLVVPGLGHWYTQDYVIAGAITAMRLLGAGIAIPGIINSNYTNIYLGGGIALASYVIDVADAPYSATRFNNKAEEQAFFLSEPQGQQLAYVSYTFTF